MSDKVVITSDKAPAPIGPYSQCIKCGNMLFLAGQIGLDPKSGKLVGPDTKSQLVRAFKNIESIIVYSGITMGQVVRCVVYLVDLDDMPIVNKAFEHFFVYEPPARSTVQVAALPAGARVEIEVTAMIPSVTLG